jgi:hypothetical protein
MKPRLRHDVHFVPSPRGAFVVMGARADLGFNVPGRDAHAWLSRIAPFLTGEHTLQELGSSLPADKRARMEALVAVLHQEGAVRDATADLPHGLSDEVRKRYAREIAFIGHGADSPEHRFELYRESNPRVVGAGVLAGALVHALLATGVARVRFVVTPECPTDLARIEECLIGSLGPGSVSRLQVSSGAAALDLASDPGGAVLAISETPMLQRARSLAEQCGRHGRIFGHATAIGDRGIVGPVGREHGSRDWAGRLWQRARGAGAQPIADLPGAAVSEFLAGPTAALVSNHLCAAFLKQAAGIARTSGEEVIEIDLETLRTDRPERGVAAATAAPMTAVS